MRPVTMSEQPGLVVRKIYAVSDPVFWPPGLPGIPFFAYSRMHHRRRDVVPSLGNSIVIRMQLIDFHRIAVQ